MLNGPSLFTPNYIGFEDITRDTIADKHTTDLAKTLFGGPHDPAILVIDVLIFTLKKVHSSLFSVDLSVCTRRGH
jgi:hypothetical protein